MTATAHTLDSALVIVREMPDVESAEIWTPTAEEVAEYAADGITATPRLIVTVWRSCRNPSDVKWAIEGLGLTCDGHGSSDLGTVYDFATA
jgi:ATP-dependent DNA ligase